MYVVTETLAHEELASHAAICASSQRSSLHRWSLIVQDEENMSRPECRSRIETGDVPEIDRFVHTRSD